MRRLPTPSTTWAATSPRTSLPATRPASTTSTRTRFRAPRPLITLTGATSVRLKQFYDAHMDSIAYVPEFNLYNQEWPIYVSGNLPPAKFVHAGRDRPGPRHRFDRLPRCDRLRR